MSKSEIKLGEPDIKVNKDKVTVTFDKGAFLNNAPDKKELINALSYMEDYSKTVIEKTNNIAISELNKHKDAKTVEAKARFGKGASSLLVRVDRSKFVPNPKSTEKTYKPTISAKTKTTLPGKEYMKSLQEKLIENIDT